MFTPLLAKIPGSLFFRALVDGEPMAFVMLAGVLLLMAGAFTWKYLTNHTGNVNRG
jgi:hypothetical protein